mmetsp:Transcript_3616/g.4855  ORF Transcript_3616/g.4855 Transcript_3616/m.4855 type:complete len:1048 (-) Transcript_3616:2573-5716(-)
MSTYYTFNDSDDSDKDDQEGGSEGMVTATVDRRNSGPDHYEVPKGIKLLADSKGSKYVTIDAPTTLDTSPADMLKQIQEADSSFKLNGSSSLIDTKLKENRMYCMVSNSWVRDFVDFVSSDSDKKENPGPVDNSFLFDKKFEGTKLKKSLSRTREFSVVTVPVWELLMQWFGGGPRVERLCYKKHGSIQIDQSGHDLRVISSKDMNHYRRLNYPKNTSVQQLKEDLCKIFDLDVGKVRLFDYFQEKPHARLDKKTGNRDPISDKNLVEDNWILIENERDDGTYLIKKTSSYMPSGYGGYGGYHDDTDKVTGDPAATPGTVGLLNIGNTCYMASTLQCLSNIPQLKEYFVSDEYKAEINEDNPLACDGKLVEAFGGIMHKLWDNEGDVVEPRGFKAVISDIKPEFAGWEQHDSQELLSHILDGLHEEVNRIKRKPATEKPLGNGRPDEVVAKESLDTYKLRNDSKISDLFTGMFKSTVKCPDASCQNVSVTFDPYMILQLPLQTEEEMYHTLHIIFVNAGPNYSKVNPPVEKFNVVAPKHGPLFLLRRVVAKRKNIPSNSVMLTKVSNSRIVKRYADGDDLASISSVDAIVAFYVENADTFLDSTVALDVDWRRRLEIAPERYDGAISGDAQSTSSSSDGYGSPDDLEDLEDSQDEKSEKENDKSKSNNKKQGSKGEPEAEDDLKPPICFPGCPWVAGDVWQGHYQYEDSEQLLRMEIVDVKMIDNNNFKVEAMFDTREDTFVNDAKYKSHSAFQMSGTYTRKNKPHSSSNNKNTKKSVIAKKKKSTSRWGKKNRTSQISNEKSSVVENKQQENIEEDFTDGSITFQPSSDEATLFKGETSTYARYGRYQNDAQEESREPMITVGFVDTHHKFFWGKVNNLQQFKRGEIFAQRMESRAWNATLTDLNSNKPGTSKAKGNRKTIKNTTPGPILQIPEIQPQDQRVAVLLCHRRKRSWGSGPNGRDMGSRWATHTHFNVPSVTLLHQKASEGDLYSHIQELFKGMLEASGKSMDVNEMMHKMSLIRVNHKFETPSYEKKNERETSNRTGN